MEKSSDRNKSGLHRTPRQMNKLLARITIFALMVLSFHALAQPTQSTAQKSMYFGMHVHKSDAGTKWPTVSFGGWRLWDSYVAWPNLEPERGQWDFRRLDRYVAMARVTGVEILLPLGLSPRWASARPTEKSSYALGNAAEPQDMEDWRNYVRTVATRYKEKIKYFEIWNEVNEAGFFSGTPEKMVELTCEAQRVLKSVSPENRLVSPSMVGLARAPELLGAFLEKGGKHCIDIVGFHFYVPKGPPEAVLPLVARVRAAMLKADVAQLPLWNTESGWWFEKPQSATDKPDPAWLVRVTPAQAGAWVARSLILGRFAKIDRYYWYGWDSKDMGLIDPRDGALRHGAYAYAKVASWLPDDAIVNCITANTRWTCSVIRQSSQAKNTGEILIWDTGAVPVNFSVPNGKIVEFIDYADDRRLETANVESIRNVVISGLPVKITFKQ